jgi:hypothetical protein
MRLERDNEASEFKLNGRKATRLEEKPEIKHQKIIFAETPGPKSIDARDSMTLEEYRLQVRQPKEEALYDKIMKQEITDVEYQRELDEISDEERTFQIKLQYENEERDEINSYGS